MKKYALLDTDFISKAYAVSDDAGNHLINAIMELPEYEFFCHAQILAELRRSDVDAPLWLEEKIEAHEIKCYTDHAVLKSLSSVYGTLAPALYTQMLKEACSVFSRSFFSEHYSLL